MIINISDFEHLYNAFPLSKGKAHLPSITDVA